MRPHPDSLCMPCSVLRRSAAASEEALAPSCSRMLSTQVRAGATSMGSRVLEGSSCAAQSLGGRHCHTHQNLLAAVITASLFIIVM